MSGVRTTQRSIAAMAPAWVRRTVRQLCDGGLRCRMIYLETVDPAISNPELQQFTVDAWATPQRVLLAHPMDEFAQLTANRRPPSPSAGFPAPIGAKSCSMPPQYRVRPNDPGPTEAGLA